jgi:hypothetical protein
VRHPSSIPWLPFGRSFGGWWFRVSVCVLLQHPSVSSGTVRVHDPTTDFLASTLSDDDE